ncbi:MAG: ExbD/TolR family protein [Verrucomicrobiales bacterium]
MARRKQLEALPDDEPGLDMSSLIDVSFLLLIYFIVTSSLEKREADLGLTLPTENPDSSSASVEIDQMMIVVDPEGAVVVNDEILDTDVSVRALPGLLERLRMYKKAADLSGSKPLVVVAADDDSKGQRLVDVLNALAAVGITHVTMTGFREE